MELKDFKDKKITVMGIGLHGGGVGVIKFLAEQGAKVLATDLRKKEELEESLKKLAGLDVEYILGQHRAKDFTDADMIIKNPAVPDNSEFLAAARQKNIPIESDIGIFFELCPAQIIGITGTKGKSTTATLLAYLLSKKFPQVILAGNIRASVLEKLPEITKDSVVVLELSSWQLADAKNHKKSPYVALITNIFEDHLNRYNEYQDYIDDKKLLFKFQGPKDYLFVNHNEPNLREIAKEAKSRVYFYSLNGDELIDNELSGLKQESRLGAYLKRDKIYFGASREEICNIADIKLFGRHILNNVLGAISIARLYDVAAKDIKIALREFPGLDGRLQLIADKHQIKYFNDTTATNPEAAIAAINGLSGHWPDLDIKNHLILIAGGADKDLKFKDFAKTICEKCKAVILLAGTATPRLEREIDNHLKLTKNQKIIIKKTDSMEKAVEAAKNMAEKNDIILLSPGCASFGIFKHEFERGELFNQAVLNRG